MTKDVFILLRPTLTIFLSQTPMFRLKNRSPSDISTLSKTTLAEIMGEKLSKFVEKYGGDVHRLLANDEHAPSFGITALFVLNCKSHVDFPPTILKVESPSENS
ncbi:hypothetical protein E1B28_004033 [Marasmius oreades]|uniref:Uncharacterized protein n=1 Tax=Marasmius oreades TaxID=181124 RepID=A0A9P7UXT7_9AGAR|nr:uncharacterized protein E1B28_004033 [Marasmius oreades]KAG7096616.1 hypothetical protein E1B28_004033 [Marasmius oreades]